MDVHLAALPACLTAATASLTRLTVSRNVSAQFGVQGPTPGSTQGLGPVASLTALELLELQRCALAAGVPIELSRLSTLRELGLDGSLGPAAGPAPLMHLSALGALRMLSVQRCSIVELDHGLQVGERVNVWLWGVCQQTGGVSGKEALAESWQLIRSAPFCPRNPPPSPLSFPCHSRDSWTPIPCVPSCCQQLPP